MLCEVLSTIEHQNLGGTPGVFLVGRISIALPIQSLDRSTQPTDYR